MSIIYHQMKYEAKENKYVITKLKPSKNIDTTKLNDDVIQLSGILWAARRKQQLIDYAEEMKANRISEYKRMINTWSKRSIEA